VGFKSMPERPEFLAYLDRVRARPAYVRAKEIDNQLIAEMQQ
jgi:glutathione S-transferase